MSFSDSGISIPSLIRSTNASNPSNALLSTLFALLPSLFSFQIFPQPIMQPNFIHDFSPQMIPLRLPPAGNNPAKPGKIFQNRDSNHSYAYRDEYKPHRV